MISTARYCALLSKRLTKPLTEREASAVETYEFFRIPPKRAEVWVLRNKVSAGTVDHRVTIVNSYGAPIGEGFLGRYYECNGSRRYRIKFTAKNGLVYRGTYFPDHKFARVTTKGL